MKKIIALTAILAFSFAVKARADTSPNTPQDIVTFEQKGSSTVALGVSSIGVVYADEGLVNVQQTWLDLPAPSTISVFSILATTGAIDDGRYTVGVTTIVQPPYAAVIGVQASFNLGTATTVITSTMLITGFDSVGSSRTEYVRFSTVAAKTLWAYSHISSITFINTTITTHAVDSDLYVYLAVGSTNTYGLINDIQNANDVYGVTEANTHVSSATINADYNTYTPVTRPTGVREYLLNMRVRKSPPHRKHPDQ